MYVSLVYIIIIANAMAIAFTFGSALLLTIPASYLVLICAQYVNYFTIKGKKYFVTFGDIATNECKGDTEHFFDYVDDTAGAGHDHNNEPENENKKVYSWPFFLLSKVSRQVCNSKFYPLGGLSFTTVLHGCPIKGLSTSGWYLHILQILM